MFILYVTTNVINNKIYIGVHQQDEPYEFDGYLGSGVPLKNAIKKYGKNNFKRETLLYYYEESDAYRKESEIVNENFIKRNFNYNAIVGGHGASSGHLNPMYGKPSWNKGIPASEESRLHQSNVMKGRTPWNKGKKGLQESWNKGTKGLMKPNKTSWISGQSPWNKGKSNPIAKNNAIKGIENSRKAATGRKMAIREDGTRYWIKPIAVPAG